MRSLRLFYREGGCIATRGALNWLLMTNSADWILRKVAGDQIVRPGVQWMSGSSILRCLKAGQAVGIINLYTLPFGDYLAAKFWIGNGHLAFCDRHLCRAQWVGVWGCNYPAGTGPWTGLPRPCRMAGRGLFGSVAPPFQEVNEHEDGEYGHHNPSTGIGIGKGIEVQ